MYLVAAFLRRHVRGVQCMDGSPVIIMVAIGISALEQCGMCCHNTRKILKIPCNRALDIAGALRKNVITSRYVT